MDLVKSKMPDDITTVKNQIYEFIKNSIMPIFEKNVVEDAKSFFNILVNMNQSTLGSNLKESHILEQIKEYFNV